MTGASSLRCVNDWCSLHHVQGVGNMALNTEAHDPSLLHSLRSLAGYAKLVT